MRRHTQTFPNQVNPNPAVLGARESLVIWPFGCLAIWHRLGMILSLSIVFLLCSCQEAAQVEPQSWRELRSELMERSTDETHLFVHLKARCSKNVDNQPNPNWSYCFNWLSTQLASAKDSLGNHLWSSGRGILLSKWLLSIDPNFVLGLQIQARELFLAGQVEEARKILLSLKEKEHAGGFEVYWLAQLERQMGRYHLAKQYAKDFEKYERETPQLNGSLQNQMIAEAADDEIERDWAQANTSNFRIYTTGDMTQAEWVGEILELKWAELLEKIGNNFQDPLEVVIYDDKQYGGQAAHNEWVAASYNGKLRIPQAVVQDTRDFHELMTHELTHAFLDRGIGRDVPMWFHEGLAQYMEGRRVAQLEGLIPKIFEDKQVPSFSDLQESFIHESDGQKVQKRYVVALAMVEAMIDQGGMEEFQNLISLSLQNNSFVESWPTIYSGERWKMSALYKTALSSLF